MTITNSSGRVCKWVLVSEVEFPEWEFPSRELSEFQREFQSQLLEFPEFPEFPDFLLELPFLCASPKIRVHILGTFWETVRILRAISDFRIWY